MESYMLNPLNLMEYMPIYESHSGKKPLHIQKMQSVYCCCIWYQHVVFAVETHLKNFTFLSDLISALKRRVYVSLQN